MEKGDRVRVYIKRVYCGYSYNSFKGEAIVVGESDKDTELLVEFNEEKGKSYSYPISQLIKY